MFLSFIQDIFDVNSGQELPDISVFLNCFQIIHSVDVVERKKKKMLEDILVDKIPLRILPIVLPTIKLESTPSLLNFSKDINQAPRLRRDETKGPVMKGRDLSDDVKAKLMETLSSVVLDEKCRSAPTSLNNSPARKSLTNSKRLSTKGTTAHHRRR
jgi:hypothetical protein